MRPSSRRTEVAQHRHMQPRLHPLIWRNMLSPCGVATVHALLAFILYRSSLIFGKPFLFSTDNVRYQFPQFLFDIHVLRTLDFPAWNQYLQAGIYYPACGYSIVYSPYIWLLSTVPLHHLLTAITLLTVAHQIAAGLFSYMFFSRFTSRRSWALYGSIVYVSSGMLFASQSVYLLFLAYCLMPAVLYFTTTLDRRHWSSAVVFLSGALAYTLLCTHVVAVPLILLSTLVGFLVYYGRAAYRWRAFCGVGLRLAVAAGIAVVVAAVRYVPIMDAVRGSPRLLSGAAWLANVWSGTYQLAVGVVPELAGLRYLAPSDTPGNLRGTLLHDFSYLGVTPLFLLLVGAAYVRLHWGLTIAALFAVGFGLRIKPLFEIVELFFAPVYHAMMLRIAYPLLVVALVVVGGSYCQDRFALSRRGQLRFFSVVGAAAIALVAVAYAVRFDTVRVPRILICLSVACGVAWWVFGKRAAAQGKRLGGALYWCGVSAVLAVMAMLVKRLAGQPVTEELLTNSRMLALSIAGYLVLSITLRYRSARRSHARALGAILLTVVVLCVAGAATSESMAGELSSEARQALVLLSMLKVIVGLSLLGQMLALREARLLRRAEWFGYMCTILIVDLLPFATTYSGYFEGFFIPYESALRSSVNSTRVESRLKELKTRADLRDYRVNSPNEMVGIFEKGFISHAAYSLGLRSYGGFNSLENLWLLRLLERFDPEKSRRYYGNGTSDDYSAEKLLDVLGVRYDVVGGTLVERPSALSRFALFSEYECLGDQSAVLDRVSASAFEAQKKVLLNKCPSIPSSPGRAAFVAFGERRSGLILMQVGGPGVLFFGDAYHEGWHPYVNGQRRELLRADGAFMAVEVPPGPAHVEWRFEPTSFRLGALISLCGVACFVPVLCVAAVTRVRVLWSQGLRFAAPRATWIFVVVIAVMAAAYSRGSIEPGNVVEIVDAQSSAPGNGVRALLAILDDEHPGQAFEVGPPLPDSITLKLDLAQSEVVRRYEFATGKHGIEAVRRMPRRWAVFGSNDGAHWMLLEQNQDDRSWTINERRRYRLSAPASYRYLRFDFIEAGSEQILRLYGLRLYSD